MCALVLPAPLAAAQVAAQVRVSVMEPVRVQQMADGALRIETPVVVQPSGAAPYVATPTRLLAAIPALVLNFE